jgi:hypothetical protein
MSQLGWRLRLKPCISASNHAGDRRQLQSHAGRVPLVGQHEPGAQGRLTPSLGRLAQALGGPREIVQTDAGERLPKGMLGLAERRHHDLLEQLGMDERYAIDFFRGIRSPQDFVDADLRALASQFVTAARATNASENAVSHQGLEHRFQVAGWKAVTRRQQLRREWPRRTFQRDIDHGRYSKRGFARQEGHNLTSVRVTASRPASPALCP